ncbi:unnamed protein product [Lactuca saligna]|uniref:Uncharacterized protein n=1 Tax=Lactuca saligna TaxID=75948 RepID=A0AA35YK18_LACSI|nr:unnamed protein product [Lactuca saligna]
MLSSRFLQLCFRSPPYLSYFLTESFFSFIRRHSLQSLSLPLISIDLSSSLTAPSSAHNHRPTPLPIGTCFYHIHTVSTSDGYQIHIIFSYESSLQVIWRWLRWSGDSDLHEQSCSNFNIQLPIFCPLLLLLMALFDFNICVEVSTNPGSNFFWGFSPILRRSLIR